MRVEVQIESEEPVIYPVKEAKLIIGSGEAAHIILPATTGISRKHAQLTIEGDKIFVTDLGSTNGSFINEDRLIPGSRAEFTSFFPVRLGEKVYVTLINDDDDGKSFSSSLQEPAKSVPKKEQTASRSFALGDLKKPTKAKAKAAVENKFKPTATKGSSKVADSSRMKSTVIAISVFVGVAVAYNHFSTPKEDGADPTIGTEDSSATPAAIVNNAPKGPVRIAPEEIPTPEEFKAAFGEMKCATTLEKKLCDLIPEATFSFSGVVESIGRVIVLLPEYKWHQSLQTLSVSLDPEHRTRMIMHMLLKAVPAFPWKEVDKNIFFVFYTTEEGRPKIVSSVGIKSSEIEGLISIMAKDLVQKIIIDGTRELAKYAPYSVVIMPAEPFVEVKVVVPEPVVQAAPEQPKAEVTNTNPAFIQPSRLEPEPPEPMVRLSPTPNPVADHMARRDAEVARQMAARADQARNAADMAAKAKASEQGKGANKDSPQQGSFSSPSGSPSATPNNAPVSTPATTPGAPSNQKGPGM